MGMAEWVNGGRAVRIARGNGNAYHIYIYIYSAADITNSVYGTTGRTEAPQAAVQFSLLSST